MMDIFEQINSQLSDRKIKPRTTDARNWLANKVKRLSELTPGSILKDKDRTVTQIKTGKLYFYSYDPKTKEKLRYYDIFPLVLPVQMEKKQGFMGLNFHYIRPKHRIILMEKLYETLNNRKFNESTKIRISYDLLNGASRLEEFKPCLKKYLFSHIRSSIIEIDSSEWETALMLPVDSFEKANRTKVYRDSEKEYK